MRRRWIFVAFVVLTLALAGCGATASAAKSGPPGGQSSNLPTALTVTRNNGIPADHFPPFQSRSTDDTAAVQRLYHAMYALPKVNPTGVYACPIDFGIVYTLAYTRDGKPLLTVPATASGCEWLHLSGNDYRWINDAFWTLLAQTIGIPPASIHPMPAT